MEFIYLSDDDLYVPQYPPRRLEQVDELYDLSCNQEGYVLDCPKDSDVAVNQPESPSTTVSDYWELESSPQSRYIGEPGAFSNSQQDYPINSQTDANQAGSPVENQVCSFQESVSAPVSAEPAAQLIKSSLNMKIQRKLIAEGRDPSALKLEKEVKMDEITPEIQKKQDDKKERNRASAKRSRDRKKQDFVHLQEKNKLLLEENVKLKQDIGELKIKEQNMERIYIACKIQQESGEDNFIHVSQPPDQDITPAEVPNRRLDSSLRQAEEDKVDHGNSLEEVTDILEDLLKCRLNHPLSQADEEKVGQIVQQLQEEVVNNVNNHDSDLIAASEGLTLKDPSGPSPVKKRKADTWSRE